MGLTVAAAHAAPEFLDRDGGIEKACSLIVAAAEGGVDMLVFPEVFVPGFPYWINCYAPLEQTGINVRYMRESVEVPSAAVERVQGTAREGGVAVVLGVSEREGGTLYNTQLFIDRRGVLIGRHRKLVPTYAERYIWGQGDASTLAVFDLGIGARVGGLVCWEHTMNLARHALILQGEQIHAGAWPGMSTMKGWSIFDEQVEVMMRAHAISGQVFCVVAGSPVSQQMIATIESLLGPQDTQAAGGGWSAVIHPMTGFLAGPHVGLDECLVAASIDLGDIDTLKTFTDAAGHSSRREVLRLLIDAEPKTALIREGGASPAPAPIAPPAAEPASPAAGPIRLAAE